MLEGNLISSARGGELKSLLITSSRHQEGKTTAAIAMARTLSSTGQCKVLLVDGNLRNPNLHLQFSANHKPGLTDYIEANVDEKLVVRNSGCPNLNLILRGTDNSGSSSPFRAQAFSEKLDGFRKTYDYVIFDSDSIMESSNVAIAARYFDGVIIIVECEKTTWSDASIAKESIDNAGGRVLGVILNKRKYYVPKFVNALI